VERRKDIPNAGDEKMRRMRFRTQVHISHLPSPTRLSSRTQPTQFPTCRTSNEHRLTATEHAMDARRPHHPNSYSHLHLRPCHECLPAFAATTSRISSTLRKTLSRHCRASLHCTADCRTRARSFGTSNSHTCLLVRVLTCCSRR
jgi:hypothetical protein